MKIRILLMISVIWLFSCQKDFFAPLIITGIVTGVDQNGALFSARITSLGEMPVLEFGFVWDTVRNPTIEVAEMHIIHKQAELGNYTSEIKTGLIPGKTYFVRSFIRNANILTYGDEVSFLSQGGSLPEISGIKPAEGNLGDTLVLIGKNFSTRSSTVKIDQIAAGIIRSNQDSVFVIIPATLKSKNSAITLTNLNKVVTAKDSFSLISPIITGFEAASGTFGDEVIIRGSKFSRHKSSLKVFFDKASAVFNYVDDQTLRATVPVDLSANESYISVSMNSQITQSTGKFSLLPVEIDDFNPKIALTGDQITITGMNFNPIASKNKVYIGGVVAKAVSVNKTTMIISLPKQDSVVYESRNSTVTIESGGISKSFFSKLTINDRWFRRADVPYELRHETYICTTCPPMISYRSAHSFVVGKTAYIGLNASKNFWAFDTEKNTWRKLAEFPGVPRINATGFVSGDKIFIGTGENDNNYTQLYSDWWEYDTTSDRWTRKADFPFGARSSLKAFVTGSGFYMAQGFYWNQNTGYGLNLWKYNPLTDTWSKEVVDVQSLKKSLPWRLAKSVNKDVFVGYLDGQYASQVSFYIYHSDTKTFTAIPLFPYRNTFGNVNSMVLNNRIYVNAYDYSNSSKNFYYYDTVSNSWKFSETTIYADISYGITFEAENLGFVGMGSHNQLFEFDPNR